jgi:integrase
MARQIHRLSESIIRNAQPRITVIPTRMGDDVIRQIRTSPNAHPLTKARFKGAKRINGKLVKIKGRLMPDGGGLYLQVTGEPAGNDEISIRKSWLFRYAVPGQKVVSKTGKARQRERAIGLGSLNTVSLAEAREKARKCRQQLLDGIDPIEAKRTKKAEAAIKLQTFDECRGLYVAGREATWNNEQYRQEWTQQLKTYVSPVIGSIPVAHIDSDAIIKTLQPIWNEMPSTANRIRGRIEQILDFARITGKRPQNEANPARWKGHLEHVFAGTRKLQPVKHMAALPWREVPELWTKLQADHGTGAKALQLLILTAVRTGELRKATVGQFNLSEPIWSIPAPNTKRKREHQVPLSDAAIELIASILEDKNSDELLFAMGKNSMEICLKRIRPGVTVHGFRSTFRDWAGDFTEFPREVAEACLAHAIGNDVELSYKRTTFIEKRAKLMQMWGDYVTGKLSAGNNNIVPLRQQSA